MSESSFITIVSGLPRSGTSLMMHMLHAGGMPVLTDHIRRADVSNPCGYFELEAVKETRANARWLETAAGHAVKMIYRLLYDLPSDRSYRVLFMRRDLRQVVASQQAMLGKTKATTVENQRLEAIFHKEITAVDTWLAARNNFTVHDVSHAGLIGNPELEAEQIKTFLDYPLNIAAMCAVVNPAMHRQK